MQRIEIVTHRSYIFWTCMFVDDFVRRKPISNCFTIGLETEFTVESMLYFPLHLKCEKSRGWFTFSIPAVSTPKCSQILHFVSLTGFKSVNSIATYIMHSRTFNSAVLHVGDTVNEMTVRRFVFDLHRVICCRCLLPRWTADILLRRRITRRIDCALVCCSCPTRLIWWWTRRPCSRDSSTPVVSGLSLWLKSLN